MIHREMVAAGVKLDSHESDLYVEDTPTSRAILARHPTHEKNARPFRHAVTGEAWLDVPFAFEPFWQRKAQGSTS